jgi:hypothetical protein
MDGCPLWVLCVLSGRGLYDGLITRPGESYRLWCVLVCDLETSRMRWLKLVKGCKCRMGGGGGKTHFIKREKRANSGQPLIVDWTEIEPWTVHVRLMLNKVVMDRLSTESTGFLRSVLLHECSIPIHMPWMLHSRNNYECP